MTRCKKGTGARRETNVMSKLFSQVTGAESAQEVSVGDGWEQKETGQGRGRRMGGGTK